MSTLGTYLRLHWDKDLVLRVFRAKNKVIMLNLSLAKTVSGNITVNISDHLPSFFIIPTDTVNCLNNKAQGRKCERHNVRSNGLISFTFTVAFLSLT